MKLRICKTGIVLAGFFAIFHPSVQAADRIRPIARIVSPADNSAVRGPITVIAEATDNVRVASVQFFVDGYRAQRDRVPPYTMVLDTSRLSDGEHRLHVRVWDSARNSALSPVVDIQVENAVIVRDAIAPTVSLSVNPAGPIYPSPQIVTLTADASDNVAVSRVEFYDGAALRSTATTSPYTYSFTVSAADNGAHSWTARAYDSSDNVAVSSALELSVNIDGTPPAVSLTSPVSGATVIGSSVVISANATDNTTVTGVQFLLDGANLDSQDTANPYTISWNTISVANGAHTLQAIAVDQASNSASSALVTVTVNNPQPLPVGNQIYVDGSCGVSGNGASSTCGSSGPFRTIQEGLLAMPSGYTLSIRGAHDGFDGVYREFVNLGSGGRALACTAALPCVIRGYPNDPHARLLGSRRYTDWQNRGGGVYARVSEQTAVTEPTHNRDAWDPNTLYFDDATQPMPYAGDNVSAPTDGAWSYNPTTHEVAVNPPGVANADTIEVPFFHNVVVWAMPTEYLTLQHLTMEMSRAANIQTYGSPSNNIEGLILRDLRVLGFPRFAIRMTNGAVAPVFEDLDIQYGCRGNSWGGASAGCYGLRIFQAHNSIFRNIHIAHLGSTGRTEITAYWGGPYLDAPWNDPQTTEISFFGFCFNLKQTTGSTIEDFSCEDYSQAGIGVDVSNAVVARRSVLRRGQTALGVIDFTPSGQWTQAYDVTFEDTLAQDIQPASGRCVVNMSPNGHDPYTTLRRTTFERSGSALYCPSSGTGITISDQ